MGAAQLVNLSPKKKGVPALLPLMTSFAVVCRPYWRCYFPNTQAVIYVVDSSDTDRMSIAKDEFHAILQVSHNVEPGADEVMQSC
jgi:hypothetical protein